MKQKLTYTKTDSLIPYARNSRTHTEQQVAKVAASIKEFGFLNPVITDGDNGIIAGHCRVMAAQKLGMDEVPTLEASHLSEAQKRAYVIADNRMALDADWDEEMLKAEIQSLNEEGFDLELTGFDNSEIKDFFDSEDGDNPYTRKIEAPVYEPRGEKPEIDELYSTEKRDELVEKIKQADIPDEEKQFLYDAADRHLVFNFERIADYYAHSSPEVQNLMEHSALVIIDFAKAVENGYVKLQDDIADTYLSEHGNA